MSLTVAAPVLSTCLSTARRAGGTATFDPSGARVVATVWAVERGAKANVDALDATNLADLGVEGGEIAGPQARRSRERLQRRQDTDDLAIERYREIARRTPGLLLDPASLRPGELPEQDADEQQDRQQQS